MAVCLPKNLPNKPINILLNKLEKITYKYIISNQS